MGVKSRGGYYPPAGALSLDFRRKGQTADVIKHFCGQIVENLFPIGQRGILPRLKMGAGERVNAAMFEPDSHTVTAGGRHGAGIVQHIMTSEMATGKTGKLLHGITSVYE